MDTNQLKPLIERLCNKLWAAGLTNPVTYVEQISYLFFLKMLEEWDDQRAREATLVGRANGYASIFAGDSNKHRWSVWTHIPDNERMFRFVRDKVFPFMASLSEREEVRRFFRDARFQIPDGVTLRDVVDLLRDVRFYELDADVKGDLYEYLLNQMATSGRGGQFRTPRHIIRTMVQMVDPRIGETILDPACGTGGFLLGAYDWVRLENSDAAHIGEVANGAGQPVRRGPGDRLSPTQWDFLQSGALFGFDVDQGIVRIGTMNLILHGLERSQVMRRDALAGSPDDWEDRQFDVILSNPPFSGRINRDRIRGSLPVRSAKTEILFLGLMVKALRDGGRCGVIVPEGLLFGSTGAHKEVRQMLLEQCDLQAVVSLPGGVFQPYSGVKTSVLVFGRPGPTESVWFYDVTADGFSLDQRRQPIAERNDIPHLLAKWPDRIVSERSWAATSGQITENDFNLSAGRYRPVSAMAKSQTDPRELLSKLGAVEQDILSHVRRLDELLGKGGSS